MDASGWGGDLIGPRQLWFALQFVSVAGQSKSFTATLSPEVSHFYFSVVSVSFLVIHVWLRCGQ